MGKTRVLVVDDSLSIRSMFTEFLSSDPDIEVVGSAPDPLIAREKIKELSPDVITLDVEMPKMDGITFLQKIMSLRPMPVVMVSSLTEAGADITLRALEIGAVDYICKPANRSSDHLEQLRIELIAKVKQAARARVVPYSPKQDVQQEKLHFQGINTRNIIALGASTGGVEALREILMRIPENAPAIVITQHMPENFTASFARRLDSLCSIRVHEAKHNQSILPGNAYIAPGGSHLRLVKSDHHFYCHISHGQLVSGHRPSVDVLFSSVAENCGQQAVAALLTGMGRDGAEGLLKIKQHGGHTIAQNEASCVVYGMPKAAKQLGAVCIERPLNEIGAYILSHCMQTAAHTKNKEMRG